MRDIMADDAIAREIDRLPTVDLSPIVRNILNNKDVIVAPDWKATPLSSPSAGNGTLGLWRVS